MSGMEPTDEMVRAAKIAWGNGTGPTSDDDMRNALRAALAAMPDRYRAVWIAALEAATGPSMRHDFKMWMCGVVACRVCGIVKRRDGNNKPCRGPAEVAIRARGEG